MTCEYGVTRAREVSLVSESKREKMKHFWTIFFLDYNRYVSRKKKNEEAQYNL